MSATSRGHDDRAAQKQSVAASDGSRMFGLIARACSFHGVAYTQQGMSSRPVSTHQGQPTDCRPPLAEPSSSRFAWSHHSPEHAQCYTHKTFSRNTLPP